MADKIAILAAPGKLVAEGSPVALKSTLGQGYSVHVTFDATESTVGEWVGPPAELISRICTLAPHASVSAALPHQVLYHLQTRDAIMVQQVLQLLDDERSKFRIASYDILATSIESIFLTLMRQEEHLSGTGNHEYHTASLPGQDSLKLTDSRPMSSLAHALTISYKRALVARRSWLTPLLLVLVAVVGSSVPLIFISGRPQTCVTTFLDNDTYSIPLYLPYFLFDFYDINSKTSIVTSPPDIAKTLGNTASVLPTTDVTDNSTFIDVINQNYRNLSLGGISLDLSSGHSLVAWEANPPGLNGPVMLNFATNILYNHALNSSGNAAGTATLILANYDSFPVSTKSPGKV